MADVEVLFLRLSVPRVGMLMWKGGGAHGKKGGKLCGGGENRVICDGCCRVNSEDIPERTFMPSSEKQGGTAELSSSASERRMGNFSTADMGMSPR